MARPLRLGFAGALYQVTSRGDLHASDDFDMEEIGDPSVFIIRE